MDPIRPITTPLPAAVIDAARAVARPAEADRRSLDPAVSIALSADALPGGIRTDRAPEPDRRGFERDAETRAVVFRISDPVSGEVVLQIPDEVVVKARAYAARPSTPTGERVERSA